MQKPIEKPLKIPSICSSTFSTPSSSYLSLLDSSVKNGSMTLNFLKCPRISRHIYPLHWHTTGTANLWSPFSVYTIKSEAFPACNVVSGSTWDWLHSNLCVSHYLRTQPSAHRPLPYSMTIISCRVIVVRLMSAAGTGFYYTMKRQRVKEKMILRKYDPIGKLQSPHSC